MIVSLSRQVSVSIDPVGNGADRGARRRFRLIENGRDRGIEGLDAVFLGERDGEIAAEEAAGELRRDIAHEDRPGTACCSR